MAETLTVQQSVARIAELEAQGYTVTTEVLPNGDVVVYKSGGTNVGLSACLVIGLVGLALCWHRR